MRGKVGLAPEGPLNGTYGFDARVGGLWGSDGPDARLGPMKKFLVIAAAGGALAIGVPAAIAATDSPTTQTIQQESTPAPQPERPNGDDCPEKNGRQSNDTTSAEL